MITLINYKKILCVIIFGLTFANVFSQQEIIDNVTKSFQIGDSQKLSSSLNDQVELTILQTEDIFSKSQATILLKKFFDNNKPTSFSIIHQGDRNGTNFAIGNYISNNKEYRVYFLIKGDAQNKKIHLLRIEDKDE